MAKTKYVTMRLDTEMHKYLERMAVREQRPLSNLIYKLLTEAVAQDRALNKGNTK